MQKDQSKKVTVEVTKEQQELLELCHPLDAPAIYRGIEFIWQRAMFSSHEVLSNKGMVAGYQLWRLMDVIGRINPKFNPLKQD
jgi:hypothetical protein